MGAGAPSAWLHIPVLDSDMATGEKEGLSIAAGFKLEEDWGLEASERSSSPSLVEFDRGRILCCFAACHRLSVCLSVCLRSVCASVCLSLPQKPTPA